MRRSGQVTLFASLALVVFFAGSVMVMRRLDSIRPTATLEEVLYIPSPAAVKRMSLGYDGLMADIYWTRAVQYFGSKRHAHAQRFELLAPLLEITTTLDPHLLVAYEFGANFLAGEPPDGAGEPERAVQLIKFGIRNNPEQWRLYYNLGFVYYLELKDYAAAADAFGRGSKTPNAHPWLKILAAQMAQHAGEIATARMIWTTTYATTKDLGIQANAIVHLRALQVDEDVPQLEGLVAKYRENTGRLPSSFKELIAAGMLKSIPLDPLGHPYELTADGHVLVHAPDDLPFVQKGLPPGYVAPTKLKRGARD